MSPFRLAIIAVAVVVGLAGVALGLWWTVAGMGMVVLAQLSAERRARKLERAADGPGEPRSRPPR